MSQQSFGREWLQQNGRRDIRHAMTQQSTVRVAGGKQDFHFRTLGTKLLEESLPTHPRHHHVAQEQMNGSIVLLRNFESIHSVSPLQNGVSGSLQESASH